MTHTHTHVHVYKTVNKLARTLSEETYYAKFSAPTPPVQDPTRPYRETAADAAVSAATAVGGRLLISGLGVVCTTYACCRTVVVV